MSLLVDRNGEELQIGYQVFDRLSGQDAFIRGINGRTILVELFSTGEVVETKSRYIKKTSDTVLDKDSIMRRTASYEWDKLDARIQRWLIDECNIASEDWNDGPDKDRKEFLDAVKEQLPELRLKIEGMLRTATSVEFNGRRYEANKVMDDAELDEYHFEFIDDKGRELVCSLMTIGQEAVPVFSAKNGTLRGSAMIFANRRLASGDEKVVPDKKDHLQQVDEVEDGGTGSPNGRQTTAPGMDFYIGAKRRASMQRTGVWSHSKPTVGEELSDNDNTTLLMIDDKLDDETYAASDEYGVEYEIKAEAFGWQSKKLGALKQLVAIDDAKHVVDDANQRMADTSKIDPGKTADEDAIISSLKELNANQEYDNVRGLVDEKKVVSKEYDRFEDENGKGVPHKAGLMSGSFEEDFDHTPIDDKHEIDNGNKLTKDQISITAGYLVGDASWDDLDPQFQTWLANHDYSEEEWGELEGTYKRKQLGTMFENDIMKTGSKRTAAKRWGNDKDGNALTYGSKVNVDVSGRTITGVVEKVDSDGTMTITYDEMVRGTGYGEHLSDDLKKIASKKVTAEDAIMGDTIVYNDPEFGEIRYDVLEVYSDGLMICHESGADDPGSVAEISMSDPNIKRIIQQETTTGSNKHNSMPYDKLNSEEFKSYLADCGISSDDWDAMTNDEQDIFDEKFKQRQSGKFAIKKKARWEPTQYEVGDIVEHVDGRTGKVTKNNGSNIEVVYDGDDDHYAYTVQDASGMISKVAIKKKADYDIEYKVNDFIEFNGMDVKIKEIDGDKYLVEYDDGSKGWLEEQSNGSLKALAVKKTAGAVKDMIESFKEKMESQTGHEMTWEEAEKLYNDQHEDPTTAIDKMLEAESIAPSITATPYNELDEGFSDWLLDQGINGDDWMSTLDAQDKQGYFDDWKAEQPEPMTQFGSTKKTVGNLQKGLRMLNKKRDVYMTYDHDTDGGNSVVFITDDGKNVTYNNEYFDEQVMSGKFVKASIKKTATIEKVELENGKKVNVWDMVINEGMNVKEIIQELEQKYDSLTDNDKTELKKAAKSCNVNAPGDY